MDRASKRCENIPTVMSQVQACSWNVFRLGEIVTIEKCLQEISVQDPRVSLLLRKLANECVFLEPGRKLAHLARTKQEELEDDRLKKQSLQLRKRIEQVDGDLEVYRREFENLKEKKEEQFKMIKNIEEDIVSLERLCKTLSRELELLLERTYDSFGNSFSVITNDLFDYMQSIAGSSLIKQMYSLPTIYRQSLTRLIKPSIVDRDSIFINNGTGSCEQQQEQQQRQEHQNKQQPVASGGLVVEHNGNSKTYNNNSNDIGRILAGPAGAETNLAFKKLCINRFKDYLKDLEGLYGDAKMIESLYSNEIPDELQQYKALEEDLANLREPLRQAPKRISYIRHPTPITTANVLSLDNVEECSTNVNSSSTISTTTISSQSSYLPDRSENKELKRLLHQLLA